MTKFNPEPDLVPKVLASDLDGTLIPLPDHPENLVALEALRAARDRSAFRLVFCTGRHFSSVMEALEQFHLPEPDWIICDVGTSIHRNQNHAFPEFEAYQAHLAEKVAGHHRRDVESLLEDLPGLSPQCAEHQQAYKISYECESERTDALIRDITEVLKARELPYDAHGSIDPFLDCGLVDLLPRGVSKAYAVKWLSDHAGYHPDEVVYAGDSGNDLPALVAGFRAIVVANASEGLAEKVLSELHSRQMERRFFHASSTATSGVLEGCEHFGLL